MKMAEELPILKGILKGNFSYHNARKWLYFCLSAYQTPSLPPLSSLVLVYHYMYIRTHCSQKHLVCSDFRFSLSPTARAHHAADTHCPGAIKIRVVNRSSLIRNAEWKRQQQQQKIKWTSERIIRRSQKIVYVANVKLLMQLRKVVTNDRKRRRTLTFISAQNYTCINLNTENHFFFFVSSTIRLRIEWKGNETRRQRQQQQIIDCCVCFV